ncbi:MAG: metallophosphoesterase [Saprospiraceae bacterium]
MSIKLLKLLKTYFTHIIFLSYYLFCNTLPSLAQDKSMIDGPYVEYKGDSVLITWVDTGALHLQMVHKNENYIFSQKRLPSFSLQDLHVSIDEEVEIKNVKKYVALSDIHGQYDVFEKLMIAHGISDDNGNWIYGKGHLIIVGDILDRGDQVLKVLWYLYHLENKARKSGGRVHILLGNHEMMVMNGDLGYVHKKYRYTSGISKVVYSNYFSANTFWGKWLASKNVIKSINNTLFMHGGLSEELLEREFDFEGYNKIFREKILHHPFELLNRNKLVSLLTFQNGPLWYRGMAQPYAFDTNKAKSILQVTGASHIVIGHTSMPRVMGLYDNKIILVDSSIKFGRTGQLLIYRDETFFRGKINGEVERLIAENAKENKESLSEALYNADVPALYITMDDSFEGISKLRHDVKLSTYFDIYGLDFTARLKGAQRKSRRKCTERSIMARIPSDQLLNFGYKNDQELEVILPCTQDDNDKWISQKIGQLAKTTKDKLYKPIRVFIKDVEKKVLDTKAILILTADNND